MDWQNILYKDCSKLLDQYKRYHNLSATFKLKTILLLTFDKMSHYNYTEGKFRNSIKGIINKYLNLGYEPRNFYKRIVYELNKICNYNIIDSDNETETDSEINIEEIKKIFIIPHKVKIGVLENNEEIIIDEIVYESDN